MAWRESWTWRDSLTLWTRALELDPESSQAWHNRGRAKFQRRDLPAAITDFAKALSLATLKWESRDQAE